VAYPATIGSDQFLYRPAPPKWSSVRDPNYNSIRRHPTLKARLCAAAGPNGPVGSIWTTLSSEAMEFTARPTRLKSAV